MSKLVMIDAQIFIWGIKGESTTGQEEMVPYAKAFIDFLTNEKATLIVPSPMLVEMFSAVPVTEHHNVMSFIDKRFRVVPFDNIAAAKCGELLYLSANDLEIKKMREDKLIFKQKIKYDSLLIATAITRGVDIVYSNDSDLLKLSHGQIKVQSMPIIPIQNSLY